MKKILIFSFSALILTACGGESQTVNTNISQNIASQNSNNLTIVSSHSSNQQTVNSNAQIVQKSETRKKWSQSGNPIDTAKFDTEIAQAEKNLKAQPKDEDAKKKLAEAYFKRGFALTEARQYASALGDYRKALKLDPNYEESKKWIDQIIGIYDSIDTEYPKEGEEPPPLPFKKES
jgi:tetratricopeptide (TPR) repeat protein